MRKLWATIDVPWRPTDKHYANFGHKLLEVVQLFFNNVNSFTLGFLQNKLSDLRTDISMVIWRSSRGRNAPFSLEQDLSPVARQRLSYQSRLQLSTAVMLCLRVLRQWLPKSISDLLQSVDNRIEYRGAMPCNPRCPWHSRGSYYQEVILPRVRILLLQHDGEVAVLVYP